MKQGNTPLPGRSGGVLLHITSLPGRFGIGDLGPAAHRFVDTLAEAKQSWWQILPLGPPGAGDSPYQAFSAFAGNPALISPDALIDDGLLEENELQMPRFPEARVDFQRVNRWKGELLAAAWRRFQSGYAPPLKPLLTRFVHQQSGWLDDFALFAAIKQSFGDKSWTQWPRELVLRQPAALENARKELADAIDRIRFTQFLFFRQLDALRKHAHAKGVQLIGDVPIFVSPESADVWARPHLFQLNRDRRPKFVAGVPPDYFAKTGQRWGNPLYDWRAMRKDNFDWWVRRVQATLNQVDLVRIDHFRGFAACWTIPAHLPTAEKGRWVKAPGAELFAALKEKLGALPFIAEDLGLITPDVVKLRDDLGLPGMRVLQFAFGGGADNTFLPHHFPRNAVVYTGTHDNDTTAGWFNSLPAEQQKFVVQYSGAKGKNATWPLIRLAWASVADCAIVPMQDLLNLGSSARINTPGTSSGNWTWRVGEESLRRAPFGNLRELTETYGRARAQ